MGDFRRKLLTTTMIPAVVGLGSVLAFDASAGMCQREAAAKAYTMALENPEAAEDPVTGVAAGCGACGGGCGADNACAAACGACNPCAVECEEDPCNPCAVCEDPCGGCGASLERTGDDTWVALDVLQSEPTVVYAAHGLLPHGDAPATLDHATHLAANLVAQGFGVTGDGTAEPGPRFVLEPDAVSNGSWRYTLSAT